MRTRECTVLIGALLLCAPALSAAQAGRGAYLRTELGVNRTGELHLAGEDNDHAGGSGCDEFINPNASAYDLCDLANRGDSWTNAFAGAGGPISGAAVGYRFGRLLVEVEYFRSVTEYDQTVSVLGGGGSVEDKLAAELQRAEHRIGALSSTNLFANLYLEFANRTAVTPYLGFGVGRAAAAMDFGALWARNLDPASITSVEGKFSAADTAAIQAALAGTATSSQTELSDTLTGFQLLVGADFGITEAVSLGLRGRLVNFGSFDAESAYDRLRSHESNLRVDGSAPVVYRESTDDTSLSGITLSLKIQF